MLVSESPITTEMPPEMQDKVMHSSLSAEGFTLLASDIADAHEKPTALMIQCRSVAEIDQIFSRLSDGAEITQPLMDSFWGSRLGNLTDKYGVKWMLNWEKSGTT